MLQTIYKYKLEVQDINIIELPANSEILCVQVQNNEPYIWALVLPSNVESKVKYTIETFGTGHNLPRAKRNYIGTYQVDNGSLIFHCFLRQYII